MGLRASSFKRFMMSAPSYPSQVLFQSDFTKLRCILILNKMAMSAKWDREDITWAEPGPSRQMNLERFLGLLGENCGGQLSYEQANEFFRFRKDELMTNKQVIEYLGSCNSKYQLKPLSNRNVLQKMKWHSKDKFAFLWITAKYCQLHSIRNFAMTCQQWKEVAAILENEPSFLKKKWTAMVRHTTCHLKWSPEEEQLLKTYMSMNQYALKWTDLSIMIHENSNTHILRGCKDVRERWFNYLDPTLKKDKWTKQQDRELVRLAGRIGRKWSLIARQMPGRTENQVKNRLNSMIKRSIITEEVFDGNEETQEGEQGEGNEGNEQGRNDSPELEYECVLSPIRNQDEPEDLLSNILRQVENYGLDMDLF